MGSQSAHSHSVTLMDHFIPDHYYGTIACTGYGIRHRSAPSPEFDCPDPK